MYTAVIPVYNQADLLGRLLASIRAQTLPFAEVVVVDDASTDGAPRLARANGCRVIEMGENAGFARAVNRGWRAVTTEWVAILNSDVELDSRWLEHIAAAAEGESFATGTIFSASDRSALDGTYDLVSRAACAWRAGHGETLRAPAGEPARIAIAPGTACVYRRSVLERLDGFEESFNSYLEDVDLGLRCIGEGFTGMYVPQAIAWHQGSASFGRWNPRVVRLTSRNQVLLIARHYDRELFRSFLWPILAGQALWGLVALRHGTGLAWVAGKIDGLRGFRLAGRPSRRLREFLDASEREIRRRATGPYWRWYFRLTAAD